MINDIYTNISPKPCLGGGGRGRQKSTGYMKILSKNLPTPLLRSMSLYTCTDFTFYRRQTREGAFPGLSRFLRVGGGRSRWECFLSIQSGTERIYLLILVLCQIHTYKFLQKLFAAFRREIDRFTFCSVDPTD
jgi:hypothetical protein